MSALGLLAGPVPAMVTFCEDTSVTGQTVSPGFDQIGVIVDPLVSARREVLTG